MLDISSINAVSGILAAIGVLVGVVLAMLQLRNIARTRQMELIMSVYSLLSTREFMDAWEKMRTREVKDFEGYVKKHGLAELNRVVFIFEGLGFLLHRRFLDIDTVRELLSESTKMTWEKIKPLAEDARKQLSQRKFGGYIPLYQWTEYLYNELQKREQQLTIQ